MSTGRNEPMRVTMRDVDGRPVRLPGGRPGVVVFVTAPRCEGCIGTVRIAADAARRARAAVTVVAVESTTSRSDVATFAKSVRRSAARYVIDDRQGTLATLLGGLGVGGAVVYDARGALVARPEADPAQLRKALRRFRG